MLIHLGVQEYKSFKFFYTQFYITQKKINEKKSNHNKKHNVLTYKQKVVFFSSVAYWKKKLLISFVVEHHNLLLVKMSYDNNNKIQQKCEITERHCDRLAKTSRIRFKSTIDIFYDNKNRFPTYRTNNKAVKQLQEFYMKHRCVESWKWLCFVYECLIMNLFFYIWNINFQMLILFLIKVIVMI